MGPDMPVLCPREQSCTSGPRTTLTPSRGDRGNLFQGPAHRLQGEGRGGRSACAGAKNAGARPHTDTTRSTRQRGCLLQFNKCSNAVSPNTPHTHVCYMTYEQRRIVA